MAPIVPIAMSLLKYAPAAIKFFAGEKKAEAAKELIKIAETVTGKSGEEAVAAVEASPELQLQFKAQYLDHEEEMARLFLGDVKDARKRDVELHKMGYKNSRADVMIIGAILAIIFIVGFLWAEQDLPDSVIAILNMLLGNFSAMLYQAYQFEFGSSRGSKEKGINGSR